MSAICARCGDDYGKHIGPECPDRKGYFSPQCPCNSYPALVAALQAMVGLFDPHGLPEGNAVFAAYHQATAALREAGITEEEK